MNAENIAKKVKAVLVASTDLKFKFGDGDDIQVSVFMGVDAADQIFDTGLPYIAINPGQNPLLTQTDGDVGTYQFSLLLTGYLPVRHKEDSVLGASNHPGILGFESKIKKALSPQWPTMDGNCLNFTISTFDYAPSGTEVGRDVGIELQFTYRQKMRELE